MAVNKVVVGGRTIVDMNNATATAEDIKNGKTAYGKSGNLMTGTATSGGIVRAVYTETVTSGTQYTLTIQGYDSGKSQIDAYLNGLRLQDSEFTVTSAGVFRLTNTITGSGNVIQIIHWEQLDSEYIETDINSKQVTFSQASTRANIASRETVSTLFGKISKWFADLKTVAFSGSYNDLTNKPTIPSAVAVKGNAESSYRTGNVNLTPANIGALPTQTGSQNQVLGFTSANTVGAMSVPTGVKGNAESSYRTGNVNLTAANIGAVSNASSTATLGSQDTTKFTYTDAQIRKDGNVVSIYFAFVIKASLNAGTNHTFGVLPANYRPLAKYAVAPVYTSNAVSTDRIFWIDTSGNVKLYNKTAVSSGTYYAACCFAAT